MNARATTAPHPPQTPSAWWGPFLELLVLAGFCGFLFFYGLGTLGLVGADEPRYAQIAREMLARHDWVTPVLYGVPWMEKPILYYWEAMLSFRLFGVSDWAARLPSAVNASAIVLVIYVFMRRFSSTHICQNRADVGHPLASPLDAALIAASCAGVIGFARGASTDMPLTATFTIAMLSWLAWRIEDRKLWLAAFYVFLALGTLAKGPVAPLLAWMILILFAAVRREWRLIRRTLWLPGIALFVAVAAPWYIAVQKANHDFFRVFILEHNLARFGTNIFRHPQPFWYYGIVIPLSVLPWLVLVLAGLFTAFRISRQRDPEGDFHLFCVLWALLPAVFFSLSKAKLPGYTLPAVPPLALLAGSFLQGRGAPVSSAHFSGTVGHRRKLPLLVIHAALASAVLSAALLSSYLAIGLHPPLAAWRTAGLISLVVFCATVSIILLCGVPAVRLVTLIPLILGLVFVLRFSAPLIDAGQSARPVAQEIQQIVQFSRNATGAHPSSGSTVLAGYDIRRETEYGLAFYRNQPVAIYERGEVPGGEHLLVSRSANTASLLHGRTVLFVGSFAAQGLYLYWVGPAASGRTRN